MENTRTFVCVQLGIIQKSRNTLGLRKRVELLKEIAGEDETNMRKRGRVTESIRVPLF